MKIGKRSWLNSLFPMPHSQTFVIWISCIQYHCRCGCFRKEDYVFQDQSEKLSNHCINPLSFTAGEDTGLQFASRPATNESVFLYCIDVAVIASDTQAPKNLGNILTGDIVIGCYVNQKSSSTPVRQLFVAIVCCKCQSNCDNVVVRFQSPSDHLYQFTGGFFSICAARLVSPYNCVVQHTAKVTVCGIPGLNNHLGFTAKIEDRHIDIGDFIHYTKPDSPFLCLVVGMIFVKKSWHIIVVLDPTPSGFLDNIWIRRLCTVQLRLIFPTPLDMHIAHVDRLGFECNKLIQEVIENTRDVVGQHVHNEGVIVSDITAITKFRENELRSNPKDPTTSTRGRFSYPESRNDANIKYSHPGRLIFDLRRWQTQSSWSSWSLSWLSSSSSSSWSDQPHCWYRTLVEKSKVTQTNLKKQLPSSATVLVRTSSNADTNNPKSQKLSRDNQTLTEELNDVKKKHKETGMQLTSVSSELDVKKKEIAELRRTIKKHDSDIRTWESEKQGYTTQITHLTEQVGILEREVLNMKHENTKQETQTSNMMREPVNVNMPSKELMELRCEKEVMSHKIATLKDQVSVNDACTDSYS